MTFYTVVHEGYDVDAYRTLKAVSQAMCREGLRLRENTEEDEPSATAADIAKALRKESIVRLYEPDAPDWKYRIEKQNKFLE